MKAQRFPYVICLLFLWPQISGAQAAQEDDRFTTDRKSPVELPLAEEDDSFVFAVFGDRTGGPANGVEILAQAVADVNLVDPDLVMTVGDLIQGYNQTALWQNQADEFSGIMSSLTCPWYPVAGNHDIYWRGDNRPEREHEGNYERHFGPLWYAFRHKDCWFISLFSDEGNPITGERTFGKPASQRMSKAQFAFLDETLERARGARHVFVFLHHPRWSGGRYGDDWERVHERLARAGNVSAVFAGHIHHMVYDGIRDGIEYFTLATVGGHQAGDAPEGGYLHHWNLITVRDGKIAVSTFPVGAAMDPRLITREVAVAARTLIDSVHPKFVKAPKLYFDKPLDDEIQVQFHNPLGRGIEVNVGVASNDTRWSITPDHNHVVIPAGEARTLKFHAWREGVGIDSGFQSPTARFQIDYLAETHRMSLPARIVKVPVKLESLLQPRPPESEMALEFDGVDDCLALDHEDLALPDGPFTVECWFNADRYGSRTGLINKTEGSEFGIFLDNGRPKFLVHLAGAYVAAEAPEFELGTGRWHHIAGVFDGSEVRLYVDGALLQGKQAGGSRTRRHQALLIGADPDGNGRGNSFFDGRIDEVRISTTARYEGALVQPGRRNEPDEETLLLLHLDERVGDWVFDSSSKPHHPALRSWPRCVDAE